MVDCATEDAGTEQTKIKKKKNNKRVRRLRSIKIARFPSVKIYGGSDNISLLSADLPKESERTCDSPNNLNNTSSSYPKKKSARNLAQGGMASCKSRKPLKNWSRAANPATSSPSSLSADSETPASMRNCCNSGSNSSRDGKKLLRGMVTTGKPFLKACRISMKTPVTTSSPSMEFSINRPTCSSVLKHSKFARHLERQGEGTETKVCHYSYCSLHGKHADKNKKTSAGPSRMASYVRDLSAKETDALTLTDCNSWEEGCNCNCTSVHQEAKERLTDDTKERLTDNTIEPDDATKKASEQQNSPKEVKINDSEVDDATVDDGDHRKKDDKKKGLWHLIYQHMASTSMAENESPTPPRSADEEGEEDLCSARRDAVEMVKEALDNMISQVTDQSSSDDLSVNSDIILDDKVEGDNPNSSEKGDGNCKAKQAPKNWSKLKKMIIFSRFVKAVDHARKINYNNYSRKQEHLSSSEKVHLRHRIMDERKNPEEWMLDYALGKVIASLGAAEKRKVAMLARAFETIIPKTPSPFYRHDCHLDPEESAAVQVTYCESACEKSVFDHARAFETIIPKTRSPVYRHERRLDREESEGEKVTVCVSTCEKPEHDHARACETVIPKTRSPVYRHDSCLDLDESEGEQVTVCDSTCGKPELDHASAFETIIPKTRSPVYRHDCRLDLEESEGEQVTVCESPVYRHHARAFETIIPKEESEAVQATDCESVCEKSVIDKEDEGNITVAERNSQSDQIEAVRLVEQVIDELEDDNAKEQLIISDESSEILSPVYRHNRRVDVEKSAAVQATDCVTACEKPVPEKEDKGNITVGESNSQSDQIEAVRLVEQVIDELEDDNAKEQLIMSDESGEKVKKSWRNIKKLIILQRFVAALENQNKVDLPNHEEQAKDVVLSHQQVEERRSADEWMLDHALQQVVAKLTPARKRKVALLVEAFESVVPPATSQPRPSAPLAITN